ncbi:MAG TPA: flavin reductase family protein [Thermomicrobiales bacterium]|nr:flavin reductase family protein [Thermomicrobiales bacterium]
MTQTATPFDPAAFRRVMGQFATGVTVITVQHGDHIHGMTANAFTSVSLDPPLVLFCVTTSARMAALIGEVPGFAINILAEDQQPVSRQFAGSNKDNLDRAVALQRGPIAPLIEGSLAAVSCTTESIHEGGDHWIVVGRVVSVHESPDGLLRDPLVFFRSRYQELVEQAPVQSPSTELWSNDAIRVYHEEWSEGESEQPDWRQPW